MNVLYVSTVSVAKHSTKGVGLGFLICFGNLSLEMSLDGDAYTSEFQSSMKINKIIYDARRQSINSIFCNDNR